MLALDAKSTALVMIDLQNFIVGRPIAPHAGADVAARAKDLAQMFRAASAPVFWVRVGFSPDWRDLPPQNVDEPMQFSASMPAEAFELAEGLALPGDLHIVKRQWGAFEGTGLELQLRRRGVKTVVLGGIATNFGVESTARQAWELGFDLVIPEDVCASVGEELHGFAFKHVLPRLARVVSRDALAFS